MRPHVTFDPAGILAAAGQAASCSDRTRASLAAVRFGLDAVAGSLRTVAALRGCAAACLTSTTALADRTHEMSTKLTDSLASYAQVDEDIAAALDAILAG